MLVVMVGAKGIGEESRRGLRQVLPIPLRSCRRSQAVASGPMLPVVAHRLRLLAAHTTALAITPHALGRGCALIASHSCTLGRR